MRLHVQVAQDNRACVIRPSLLRLLGSSTSEQRKISQRLTTIVALMIFFSLATAKRRQ